MGHMVVWNSIEHVLFQRGLCQTTTP